MRNARIDMLRAMAILLVTLFHAWVFAGRPRYVLHGVNLYLPICWGGAGGVSIFVFISGYLATHTIRRFGGLGLIRRRLWRIYPPYVVAIVLWNIVKGPTITPAWAWHNITHLTFTHTLSSNTFWAISAALWYLGLQVHLYILAAIIWRLFQKYQVAVLLFSVALAVALAYGFPCKTQKPVNHSALVFLPIFLMGAMMSGCRYTGWLPATVLWTATLAYSAYPLAINAMGFASKIWGLLICFAVLMTPRICKMPHAVKFVAVISFSVYLYQPIIAQVGRREIMLDAAFAFVFGAGMWAIVELPRQSATKANGLARKEMA